MCLSFLSSTILELTQRSLPLTNEAFIESMSSLPQQTRDTVPETAKVRGNIQEYIEILHQAPKMSKTRVHQFTTDFSVVDRLQQGA